MVVLTSLLLAVPMPGVGNPVHALLRAPRPIRNLLHILPVTLRKEISFSLLTASLSVFNPVWLGSQLIL